MPRKGINKQGIESYQSEDEFDDEDNEHNYQRDSLGKENGEVLDTREFIPIG